MLAAVVVSAAGLAQAQSACTSNSLNGGYAYLLTGFTYDQYGQQVDLAVSGRMVADGAGNLTAGDTLSYDGTIIKRSYPSGTYTMASDCTGSLTLTSSNGNKANFDFVLHSDGKEMNLIETDAGVILSGTAKRQVQVVQVVASTP